MTELSPMATLGIRDDCVAGSSGVLIPNTELKVTKKSLQARYAQNRSKYRELKGP